MANASTRYPVSNENIEKCVAAVVIKLRQRLEKKGNYCYASRHEALGLIAEEYHELVEAVRGNDIKEFESELVDIAVGCIFSLASSKTWDDPRSALEETDDIKPCPFCGDRDLIEFGNFAGPDGEKDYYVRCTAECPVEPITSGYLTEAEAIEAWNTRVPNFDIR